jgi:DNA-binding HxlR family transcriptional regulator
MQVSGRALRRGCSVEREAQSAEEVTSVALEIGTATEARERRSSCPVACTLDIVGDRWTLLVIRDLLAGKKRYGDFLASPERIPTNILADRLKRLEREGLISSARYSERPPRSEYLLTEEGRALSGAVAALADWGLRHFPGTVKALR